MRSPFTGFVTNAAGEDAGLLLLGSARSTAEPGRRAADVLEHLLLVRRPRDELGDERVLRREHEERRAEERVGPRREDRDRRSSELLDPEDDLGALGAADPVALHRQDALGPGLEQAHLVEQLVGVGGDAEEPLLEAPRSTSAPQRSQRPSITCSFASTVWSFGHQLTGASLR